MYKKYFFSMLVISFFSMQAAVSIPRTPAEIAEYLQAVQIFVSQPVLHASWTGYDLMTAAILGCFPQSVEQLLEKGLNPNGLYGRRYSFLHKALLPWQICTSECLGSGEICLSRHFSIDKPTDAPHDRFAQRRIVNILLAHGAKLHDVELQEPKLVEFQDMLVAELENDRKALESIPVLVALHREGADKKPGMVPVTELLVKLLGQ